MINKTLAILAGGKSSRMNYNNKALLSYKEKTFIEHIIEAGKEYNEIIIVANNNELYKDFNVKVVGDIYIGNGPLSGIHAAMKYSKNDYILCVACDMPLISKELLDFLGNSKEDYEVLVPMFNERMQPLAAVYSKEIIEKVEDALINKEYRLQNFIRSLDYKLVYKLGNREFKNEEFFNINTPEEFKKLEEYKCIL